MLGPAAGIAPSLQALSAPLLLAFAVYYALGFALYSLIYAAAGSLVSRPEDLQIIALPLSLIAITGYIQAILALTGGITWFIRLASYVPFWSPFVMLTRLSVGRVEPAELVVSIAILLLTIVVTAVIAIRIYGAGVLLYGQRPGFRALRGEAAAPAADRRAPLLVEEQRQTADQRDHWGRRAGRRIGHCETQVGVRRVFGGPVAMNRHSRDVVPGR